MLKKKFGLEAIERDWARVIYSTKGIFKIPSTLIIPEGCVKIGNYALYESEMLKRVIISEGVEEIGDFAFCNCWRLEKVVIPESIKKIMDYAFYDCEKLREAIIPVSVEFIGDYAFEDCYNVTIILKKPESEFMNIGNSAFKKCKNVKEEVKY